MTKQEKEELQDVAERLARRIQKNALVAGSSSATDSEKQQLEHETTASWQDVAQLLEIAGWSVVEVIEFLDSYERGTAL